MAKMAAHYRSLYDADYWGSWDLENGDRTVTIKRCVGGELTGPGGKKSKKPVIYVEGSEKGIPLNKTNGKTIASMYGNYVTEWAGKQITLYKSITRNPQDGGEIDCIRIRPEAPQPAVTLAQVLDAIKGMLDKPSRDAAKKLMSQIYDDDEAAQAVTAYQARIAEIRSSATPADPAAETRAEGE